MKKNKKFTISTTTTIRSSKSGKLEKDMKRIAKSIFSYNPKTDPNDPLFDKTTSKKGGNKTEAGYTLIIIRLLFYIDGVKLYIITINFYESVSNHAKFGKSMKYDLIRWTFSGRCQVHLFHL